MDAEDQMLLSLDMNLRAKLEASTDLSDCSDNASAASDVVVTRSAGTFNDLRGLFSPQAEPMEANIDGQMCNQASCLTNAADNVRPWTGAKKASPAKCDAVNKHHQHDKEACDNQHDQKANSKDQKRFDKKRKINSDSDLNTSSPEGKTDDNNKGHLFPLFVKTCEIQEKDAKDKKKEKFLKSAKSKKTKLATAHNNKECPKDFKADAVEELLSITEDNLQVVDVRTMVDLYDRVKQCVKKLQTTQQDTIASVKKDNKSDLKKVAAELKADFKKEMEKDIQSTIKFYEDEIKDLKKEVKNQKQKTNLVSDLLQQSYQITNDLARRLDAIELSNAKKSLILSGLRLSTNKKERLRQVCAFFEDVFEYTPSIEDTYVLGSKEDSPYCYCL